MNYEIQQELSRKADNLKFHALETEVRSLKSDIQQSNREISYLKSQIEMQYRTITDLIQTIIEQNVMPECENLLHNLKQQL